MYALQENLYEFLGDVYEIIESRCDELDNPPDLIRAMALIESTQRIIKPTK